jgi:hypothetical protein
MYALIWLILKEVPDGGSVHHLGQDPADSRHEGDTAHKPGQVHQPSHQVLRSSVRIRIRDPMLFLPLVPGSVSGMEIESGSGMNNLNIPDYFPIA